MTTNMSAIADLNLILPTKAKINICFDTLTTTTVRVARVLCLRFFKTSSTLKFTTSTFRASCVLNPLLITSTFLILTYANISSFLILNLDSDNNDYIQLYYFENSYFLSP